MPLSTIGSYLSTAQAHVEHWNQVNAALGMPSSELKLPGGYSVADLAADHDALQAAMDLVTARENARQVAAGTRDSRKAALSGRMLQFRAAVKGFVVAPAFVNALPTVPKATLAESKFLGPFGKMEELWTQLNAASAVPDFTPPLVLGSYSLAAFVSDLAGLRETFRAALKAEEGATIARSERDARMASLKRRLQQYGRVVVAALGPTGPLVASLPALSPPQISTPTPVALAGAWDVKKARAALAWSPSGHAHLAGYSVRGCVGGGYDKRLETVVAVLPPSDLAFATDWSLAAPGSKAAFKVYVITATGHERGSHAVSVTRPLEGSIQG